MIVCGVLQPGGNLGEAELSDTLGISRTPLREAWKLLAAKGLVELQSNGATFVVPIRATEIEDVFDVAAILEARAAELAAVRGSPAQFKALRQLQARMEVEHRDLGNQRQCGAAPRA
jgi:DNA-binding GntR family transcriptional regulator